MKPCEPDQTGSRRREEADLPARLFLRSASLPWRLPGVTWRCLNWLALLFVLLTALGGQVLADGKVFYPPTAYPIEARIPDQRALLAWSNGVERLIIETRFTGPGTNFAWVVPLPSAPKVEAATRGLFPTLTHLLRPRVIHSPTGWWQLAVFTGALAWLLLSVRQSGSIRWFDWVASFLAGVGAGGEELPMLGIVVFSACMFSVYGVRVRKLTFVEVVVIVLIHFLMVGFALPAMAKAKAKGGPNPVEILDRHLAGVFETTTLTARDPSALRDWLNTNGYVLPKDVEPVIADYLRDGWVFVASKVRRDASSTEAGSLHPLSFTFAAKEPVYPLRLTGVGNGNLEVDLFVFGPERAKVAGFKVRDGILPRIMETTTESLQLGGRTSWLPLAHAALQEAAGSAAFVTRLQGTLTPEQMRQDAVIQWDGFSEVRDVRYSQRGALLTVLNWTGSGLCLFLVGVAAVARWRGVEPTRYARSIGATVAVAVVATGIGYTSLEVVPVTLEKRFARWGEMRNQQLAVRVALMDELDTNAPITIEAVRVALQRGLPFALTNGLSRPPKFTIREEDSPFNYSLRQGTNGVELLFYDEFGRAEVEPVSK